MKLRVIIHESAVTGTELTVFLKSIKNTEFTFVTKYEINDAHIVELYTKFGSQIDAIRAKVRTKNIIPTTFFNDIAIFGFTEMKMAYDFSKKSPDTKVFIIPAPGELSSDIGKEGNLQGGSWQYIHEYLAEKTNSKVNKPKDSNDKQKRKNPSRVNTAVAPAIKEREPESDSGPDEYSGGEEYNGSDTPWQ